MIGTKIQLVFQKKYLVDAEGQACRYAIKVIGSRWLEIEPYLRTNGYVWNEYKTHFGIE